VASAYDKAVELYSVIYIKGLKPPREFTENFVAPILDLITFLKDYQKPLAKAYE